MKKLIFPISIILVCLIGYFLESEGLYLGRLINAYAPCQPIERTSFPCYVIYDVYMMLGLGLIAAIALITVLIRIIKMRQEKPKKTVSIPFDEDPIIDDQL